MSLFKCSKCGCIENTAECNYWWKVTHQKQEPLCSECDPDIGKWHDKFDKVSAKGMLIGADGFLYYEEQKELITHTKIVGIIE